MIGVNYVELDEHSYFIEFNNACTSGNIELIEKCFLNSSYFENYNYEIGFNNAILNNNLDVVKFFYKHKKIKITEDNLESLISNVSLSTGIETFEYIIKNYNIDKYKNFYSYIQKRLKVSTTFDSSDVLEHFISILKRKKKTFDINNLIVFSVLNNAKNCFNYFYKNNKKDIKNVFFEEYTKELFSIVILNDKQYFYIFNKLVTEFDFDFKNYKDISNYLTENSNHFINNIIQANELKNSLDYKKPSISKIKI